MTSLGWLNELLPPDGSLAPAGRSIEKGPVATGSPPLENPRAHPNFRIQWFGWAIAPGIDPPLLVFQIFENPQDATAGWA